MHITPTKRFKIIALNEHTSITVRVIATVVGSGIRLASDLSPIENLWYILKNRLDKSSSTTKEQMIKITLQVKFLDDKVRNISQVIYVEWAENEIAVVPDFHKRILFSDEAHFWLNGYVNKQNCRVWSEANPQVYVETPLHPEKLFGARYGLVESLVRTSSKTMNVTVNGDRYTAGIQIGNFFIPELNNHDVQELWFQQDGATCHTARATIDLLKAVFGDRLNSRFGPVNWPPRSCDLTPLDYFL
ncbi:uncharacterized protein TNCV_4750121 [Trichonephila clavipes]|nr:uncharacterized protein TNCV_4750121 [Trichonephila clavipes]